MSSRVSSNELFGDMFQWMFLCVSVLACNTLPYVPVIIWLFMVYVCHCCFGRTDLATPVGYLGFECDNFTNASNNNYDLWSLGGHGRGVLHRAVRVQEGEDEALVLTSIITIKTMIKMITIIQTTTLIIAIAHNTV